MGKHETSEFPERLRLLCSERGLNNFQLAKAVGLSHVSIGNFMAGQLPESEHLVRLAEFFDVTTDWLLGSEGRMQSTEAVKTELVESTTAELQMLKDKVRSLESVLSRLKAKKT